LEDIQHAQSILLIGSNMAETMPPIMQYFKAQAKNGGSLIVVDPRATPTAMAATLHLQITPGTDAALANGLLYIAIKEGYIDEVFINERTTGFGRARGDFSVLAGSGGTHHGYSGAAVGFSGADARRSFESNGADGTRSGTAE
jgi:anaerobic selenocysteine-containing dehydrogenase